MSIKKYFLYELKKYWKAAAILAVSTTAFYIIYSLIMFWPMGRGYTARDTSLIAVPIITLAVFCTIVPIIMFSFKNNQRQLDLYYSLPISVKELYLIKSAVGLIVIIAPFTVMFYAGVIVAAAMPQRFIISGFIAAYFISVGLAILLFGFNAFIFTRANRSSDGAVFIVAHAVILPLFMMFVHMLVLRANGVTWHDLPPPLASEPQLYSPYSAFLSLLNRQEYMILANYNRVFFFEPPHRFNFISYIILAIFGMGGYAGLFLTADKNKIENAGKISDTFFGYRVLIPTFAGLGLMAMAGSIIWFFILLFVVLFMLGGIAAFIGFRRSAKLKWQDIASLCAALILGLLISLV